MDIVCKISFQCRHCSYVGAMVTPKSDGRHQVWMWSSKFDSAWKRNVFDVTLWWLQYICYVQLYVTFILGKHFLYLWKSCLNHWVFSVSKHKTSVVAQEPLDFGVAIGQAPVSTMIVFLYPKIGLLLIESHSDSR